MDGDGKWRTRNIGNGPAHSPSWRIPDGRTEYHRSAAHNDTPHGEHHSVRLRKCPRKARELNAAPASQGTLDVPRNTT